MYYRQVQPLELKEMWQYLKVETVTGKLNYCIHSLVNYPLSKHVTQRETIEEENL